MQKESIDPELDMVVQFLDKCLPFSELEQHVLLSIAKKIKIYYLKEGSIIEHDQGPNDLIILRSGAVDVRSASGELLDRLGEYESININNLAEDEPGVKAVVVDDALVYRLDDSTLRDLRSSNRQFDRFFHGQRARRLRRAARYTATTPELLTTARGLIHQQVISVPATASIAEAAQKMTDNRVSSILVMEGDQLVGIVTDKDLRSRVVAKGLAFETPVGKVMTCNPIVLDEKQTLFDAMMVMSERAVHHLPVTEAGEVAGVITISDLIRSRQRDPIFMIQTLSRKTSAQALSEVTDDISGLVLKLIGEGAKANQVSRFLCAISDRITRKLLELGEQELGAPPVPYSWLAFGSQARGEIALGGDQDNAMVISDQMKPEHKPYFEKLANFVCDGLDACGYPYCLGGIMAKNPIWRLSLFDWKKTVSGWVRSPTDDAVMRVSIFFDIRCVEGDQDIAKALQTHMLETASGNGIFMAALARNALCNRPPLGFFRRFVLERDGEHRDELDLKHRGIIPVVDMARVHAIANKVPQVNTLDRLESLAAIKKMALKDSRNLQDALSFVMQVRLEQQCEQLRQKGRPSNFINPKELSDLPRKQLKDAFSTIHDGQESISQTFSAGTF